MAKVEPAGGQRVALMLLGKMKSGKNQVQITRRGGHYPTWTFSTWRADMARQVVAQVPRVRPFKAPVKATIRYTPGDLLRRDAPGIIDALWHLLEFVYLVDDDALIRAIDYRQMPLDRSRPRCELMLETITE